MTSVQSWPPAEGLRLADLLMAAVPLTDSVKWLTLLPAVPVSTMFCPASLRVIRSSPDTLPNCNVGPPTLKVTGLDGTLSTAVLLRACASKMVFDARPCWDDRSKDQLPCKSAWVVPSLLATATPVL